MKIWFLAKTLDLPMIYPISCGCEEIQMNLTLYKALLIWLDKHGCCLKQSLFVFFFVDSGSKKGMDARRSRTIKIGQSRRKSRTYQPTTSTYLVDLLEQQPATICSEKGKNPVLPGKTRVCPSRLDFFQFGRAGCIYIYIYIYIYYWKCHAIHVNQLIPFAPCGLA